MWNAQEHKSEMRRLKRGPFTFHLVHLCNWIFTLNFYYFCNLNVLKKEGMKERKEEGQEGRKEGKESGRKGRKRKSKKEGRKD